MVPENSRCYGICHNDNFSRQCFEGEAAFAAFMQEKMADKLL